MKTVVLAVLAAAATAALPALAVAQPAPGPVQAPSARDSLTEQIDRLSATIDRRLARGRLTQLQADQAHRQINDLQAELSDDRLKNGGQLSEADRFGLQARISTLKAQIDRERATGG